MQSRHNLDAIRMQFRCNLDVIGMQALKMQFRCNLDAIREDVEDQLAMFTTFTGGWVAGWVVWRSQE